VRGSGDGGIYSTAAEIGSLWRALFAGRIVSKEWVAEMMRPRSDAPAHSKRYGLGFWLDASSDAVILEGSDAGVVPLRARPTHASDSHRDLEHGWGSLADRSVSRECSLKLSDFPRMPAHAATGRRLVSLPECAGMSLEKRR
jgi:hypothetical protein